MVDKHLINYVNLGKKVSNIANLYFIVEIFDRYIKEVGDRKSLFI